MERTVKQKRRDEYNNTPSRGGGGHTHPGECTWSPDDMRVWSEYYDREELEPKLVAAYGQEEAREAMSHYVD